MSLVEKSYLHLALNQEYKDAYQLEKQIIRLYPTSSCEMSLIDDHDDTLDESTI